MGTYPGGSDKLGDLLSSWKRFASPLVSKQGVRPAVRGAPLSLECGLGKPSYLADAEDAE